MQQRVFNKNKMNFIFFALAKAGDGISGSDRIFIELAREWSKKHKVKIITSYEGVKLIKLQELTGKNLKIVKIPNKLFTKFFVLNYLSKILYAIWLGLTFKLKNYNSQIATLVYSASDFWMDVFPAVLIKFRYNKLRWLATWYQTAPDPIKGFNEGERKGAHNLSAFFYWFSQLPVKPLIKRLADFVIVNNENERKQFSKMNNLGKVLVLIGAVRLGEIQKYLKSKQKALNAKKFDAVFQGRFHPQKGVVELIDIWKKVVKKLPNANLGMIGDGPLMHKVKKQIAETKLENNVTLFGYVYDGAKKYDIFSNSKIVVHPAFYDSGGMASAEAMAFGIPCIGFDLKAYESYYPKGMIKVKTGDLQGFAEVLISLLNDDKKRTSLGLEARRMVLDSWSWESRANKLLKKII